MEIYNEKEVVTDLDKIGVNMIPYATKLMPLTTVNKLKILLFSKKFGIIVQKIIYNIVHEFMWMCGA